MCWPSPISSRTPKPTCGAISNISPASPSGCSWPIQPLAPPSAPRLDPGWSGKRFSFLPWWFRLHLPLWCCSCVNPSNCSCKLMLGFWVARCGDVEPAESCGNDFLLDPHFLQLFAFGHALQLKLECPHGGRLGCAQPWTASATPTLVRYDSCRIGLVMDDQTSPSFSERQHK